MSRRANQRHDDAGHDGLVRPVAHPRHEVFGVTHGHQWRSQDSEPQHEDAKHGQSPQEYGPSRERFGGRLQGRLARKIGRLSRQWLADRIEERPANRVAVDRGKVPPGDGVRAVRQVIRHGDVHDGGVARVDSAVVVVHAGSLRVKHFNGAEGGFERLREPDGDPGRGRFENGVWCGVGVGKVRVCGREVGPGQDERRNDEGEGNSLPSERTS